jgi:hypothetical protein
MSMTSVETGTREVTNYGGLVDALGGAATVVLAIIGLAGTRADMLLAIATVVFGAALLIQSGAILSELTHMMFPAGAAAPVEAFGGGGLSIMFLVGTAGIVLGVLALLGVYTIELTSIAVIAFGGALVFGSNSVWTVHRMKQSLIRIGGQRAVAGSEIIATEMAAGSAALQCFAGLAAIVLGILAVTGTNPVALSLIGLLVMGATLLMTGSTLSGVVQGFMRPVIGARSAGWSESPAE